MFYDFPWKRYKIYKLFIFTRESAENCVSIQLAFDLNTGENIVFISLIFLHKHFI